MKKEISELIDKMLSGQIKETEFALIIKIVKSVTEYDLEEIVNTVFAVAEERDYPINKSNANNGGMGIANWIGRRWKNLRFRWNQWIKKYPENLIVVEGDSWFEHLFIHETIDHLLELTGQPMLTLAYGGDWIGNYLNEKIYLETLKKYNAKIFLLSGGGNDLVGGGRVKQLVKKPVNLVDNEHYQKTLAELYNPQIAKRICRGREFLNEEFWTLLNIFFFQYMLIVHSVIKDPELTNIKIITQGYDYPFPSSTRNGLLRKVLKNGQWLYCPLEEAGIKDQEDKISIGYAMINAFNVMLEEIANSEANLYYIDCRGIAPNPEDWFDELHLNSSNYEPIAKAFLACIKSDDLSKKIYKAQNYRAQILS